MRHNLQAVLDALTSHKKGHDKKVMQNNIKRVVQRHLFQDRGICECCGRKCWKTGASLGPKCASGKCGCRHHNR
jgi:hypothetical protein